MLKNRLANTVLGILLSIGINQLSNAQNLLIDVDGGIVKIGRLSTTFNYSLGSDGRVVCYPSHWATARGSDGRIVAYLGGWTWDEGNDGRRAVRPKVPFSKFETGII